MLNQEQLSLFHKTKQVMLLPTIQNVLYSYCSHLSPMLMIYIFSALYHWSKPSPFDPWYFTFAFSDHI